MKNFHDFPLESRLRASLDDAGFVTPTPIQAEAIPPALAGRDVVGIAQTGTGKTLAFGVPLVNDLLRAPGRALILAPTRELAQQIEETLRRICGPLGLRTALLVGGASMQRQVNDLRRGARILVATPGRLVDHLQQGTARLKDVRVLVLDEADRMLDMGFLPPIKRIVESLPHERRTALFSATWPNAVEAVAGFATHKPVKIEIAPAGTVIDLVDPVLHVVEHGDKGDHLDSLLTDERGKVIVFSRTRHGARKVAKFVNGRGHAAAELHSDLTLAQRRAAMDAFRSGAARVLVATDIAARGLDVKDIALVVNYDLPDQPEDYVHRIGRTGRNGARGRAVTLATPQQTRELDAVEREVGQPIPLGEMSPMRREEMVNGGIVHRPGRLRTQPPTAKPSAPAQPSALAPRPERPLAPRPSRPRRSGPGGPRAERPKSPHQGFGKPGFGKGPGKPKSGAPRKPTY